MASVLATGGSARRLPVPGGDLPAVRGLRTRAEAEPLRSELRPGSRLVIVGAGLIGAEVASTATALGVEVTLVDPVPVPLIPAVGAETAATLHSMHAEHGVRVLQGVPVRITEDDAQLLVDVEQADGTTRLAADVVLAAIGIEVDTWLAESVGLAVTEGIETGPDGRTSNPLIWAAGDGARSRLADGTLLRRSEHWESAMLDGTAVAHSLLALPVPERPPSWFWSDRYGVHLEAVGSMTAPGSTVLREDGAQRVAFRIDKESRLVGCAAIDGGKALRVARRLIGRRAQVSPDELRDASVDLRKVGR